jgi:catechol 2,3-dioxygenase-like lactoylglutathione lyase family enzyme
MSITPTTHTTATNSPLLLPRLGHLVYYVQAVEEAVSFFETVFGWHVHARGMNNRYVELKTTSEQILGFAHVGLMPDFLGITPVALEATKPLGVGYGGQVSVTVPSPVEDWMQKAIASGAIQLAPVTLQPWGHWAGFVVTPFNVVLELSDGGLH